MTTGYTERLISMQMSRVKNLFKFINPYRLNIRKRCSGRVLDIGCGIGRNLFYLENKNNVGVDHNESAVKYLMAKGFSGYQPIEFEKVFSDSKNSFDTLLVSHVVEHLTFVDASELVRFYSKWLKELGQIVLICPQIKGFRSDETHVTYFDRDLMLKLLNENGFTKTRYRSFPFHSYFGKYWIYNEHIVTAVKKSQNTGR